MVSSPSRGCNLQPARLFHVWLLAGSDVLLPLMGNGDFARKRHQVFVQETGSSLQ
jgi:hypothetical protein